MKIDDNRSSLLVSLIILTSVIFFAQIAFVSANMLVYLGKNNVLSSALLQEVFSAKIVWVPLLRFLISQLVLYVLYIALIWYLTVSVGELFKLKQRAVYRWGLFLWLISVITVLAANNYFFPRSFFSKLIDENVFSQALTPTQLKLTCLPLISILMIAGIFALINSGVAIYKKNHRLRHSIMPGLSIMLIITLSMSQWTAVSRGWVGATEKKPNIILVGLDAMRPDYAANNRLAPQIKQFLGSAVNFTDAYASVAQTFPSWISMLTATEPKNNTVRINLANPFLIDATYMLPRQLQQLGYETIFASDDLRFNTILRRFGFDRIVGPAMGVNDFIIGSFNDFPLSNLLIPTVIGKALFPYSYANHEAIATYSPENFLQLIKDSLNQPTGKPLFLAVHFNTSGWPFGTSSLRAVSNASWLSMYQKSIPAADRQFGEFLQILSQQHILEHAVVVLVSDHGISLGLPGDRLVTESRYQGDKTNISRLARTEYSNDVPASLRTNDEHGLDTSYGYGGDILSQKQYQVLLAFKSYGVAFHPSARVAARVSLLDIAPTLLDILQQQSPRQYRGISLKHFLSGQSDVGPARAFFLESYNSSLNAEDPGAVASAVQAGLLACSFDRKTGFISEKPEIMKKQLASKERAVFSGDWLLAELPGLQKMNVVVTPLDAVNGKSHTRKVELQIYDQPTYMVLLNIKTREWTTELNTAWAKSAPLNNLCQELHQFYGDELACKDCCQPFLL